MLSCGPMIRLHAHPLPLSPVSKLYLQFFTLQPYKLTAGVYRILHKSDAIIIFTPVRFCCAHCSQSSLDRPFDIPPYILSNLGDLYEAGLDDVHLAAYVVLATDVVAGQVDDRP